MAIRRTPDVLLCSYLLSCLKTFIEGHFHNIMVVATKSSPHRAIWIHDVLIFVSHYKKTTFFLMFLQNHVTSKKMSRVF